MSAFLSDSADDVAVQSGVVSGVDFRIFTAGMAPLPDSTPEHPIVHMVGSSTEQDLHTDIMSDSALDAMANRATPGLLIWLNHDYTLPDSLFGSLTSKPIINRIDRGVRDLKLSVEVEMDSPNAVRTFRYIQNGRRLGCSVGCRVLNYELTESQLPKGYPGWDQPIVRILDVQPVEWSVVGVPANQRSWVENAIFGLFQRIANTPGKEDEALRLAPIAKSIFPRDYREFALSFERSARNEFGAALKSVIPRPTPQQRILWEPDSHSFFYIQNSVRYDVQRSVLADTMRELATPVQEETRDSKIQRLAAHWLNGKSYERLTPQERIDLSRYVKTRLNDA